MESRQLKFNKFIAWQSRAWFMSLGQTLNFFFFCFPALLKFNCSSQTAIAIFFVSINHVLCRFCNRAWSILRLIIEASAKFFSFFSSFFEGRKIRKKLQKIPTDFQPNINLSPKEPNLCYSMSLNFKSFRALVTNLSRTIRKKILLKKSRLKVLCMRLRGYCRLLN